MTPLQRRQALVQRWLDDGAITLVLAALAASVALGGWAWRLDRLVYDLGLSLWQRPPPPGIVIVAIDDASVEAIGRWPWPRAVHATLLEQVARARPRAVALDLVLSEPDADPEQDRLLARALAAAAPGSPAVLPVAWQAVGGTLSALEPTEPLRSAARLGAAEAPVDADGVLRHAFLHAGPAGARYPHLALALLQAGGEALPPGLPTDAAPGGAAGAGLQGGRDGRLLIRYAGRPGTVDRVSYADVLRGAVPAAQLAGRYVLIGMTGQGLGDTLATPVNGRHMAMPGIEVLANTLYTLRSGDTLTAWSDGSVALLSAAAVAALLLAFGRFGARAALPLAVVSVPLALLASLLALRGGLWVSPAPYVLAAVLAYPLWSWRRLERAVGDIDAELARIAAEPEAQALDDTPPAAGGDPLQARLQALQQAGAVVRQARRFLADSLAALPTAMLVADERGRVVLANPQAAALFDVDGAAELQGLDLPRLLGEFRTGTPFDWAAAIARPGAGTAVEAQRADGADFVVHLARVDLHGQRRLIVTIADVAPVKRAQRQREETLAFVSHDLRSPASEIVLLADLKLQGRLPMPHDTLLLELRRLAARTLAMSEDFVRAAQVQQQPLQIAAVSVAELLDEALADHRAQALAGGVTVALHGATAGDVVALDRALVARAVGNLVSNAIKHSAAGAVVDVHVACVGTRLQVAVRDHGPGLSQAQLDQLAQGDRGAAVRQARGVGLGLLFVQRVARRHGGTLQAAPPAAGPGALFTLDLPAQATDAGTDSGNP